MLVGKKIRLSSLLFGALALAFIGVGCSSSNAERNVKNDTAQKMDAIAEAGSSADSVESKSDSVETMGSSDSTESKSKDDSKSKAKEDKSDMEVKYEAEIRDEKNHIVKLETNYGDLTLELYRDLAPNHADSFFARVEDKFYEGTIFHRVISNFMIQGGDPTGTGMGDPKRPGYTIDAEFSDVKHKRGILSAARTNDPNSASCQFFVCHGDAFFLDGKYTVFGNLLAGYETLDKIAACKKGANDRPVEEIKISKVTVIK